MSRDGVGDVRALVVDDEKEVADAYALRLQGHCEVEAVYTGRAALSAVAESTVDVVLLDRHMPDMSGDEVLAELDERAFEGRVVMVTAVDPGFDVLEMPFDDYLCKPVQKEDLVAAIDQQLTANRYDDRLTEYLEVTSKIALLEAEKPASELDANDQVVELRERADSLRAEMDDALGEFDDFEAAFQEIARYE